jgi:hypothetical protein
MSTNRISHSALSVQPTARTKSAKQAEMAARQMAASKRSETREERRKRLTAAIDRIFDKHDATFRKLAE